jgi:GIY-YIG catalytic domain
MKTFIVYMATNTVNGKKYIGATSRGLRKRKNHHLSSAESNKDGCRIFNKAIRKYGRDAFTWCVLAKARSFDDMMKKEIMFIELLEPEYNISKGGRGTYGAIKTPEMRAKISNILKGRKPSMACVEARRAAGYIGYNKKSVVCLNDGVTYNSISEAAVAYNLSNSEISKNCRNESSHVGGKHFIFGSSKISRGKRREMIIERETHHASKRRRVQKRKQFNQVICAGLDKLGRRSVGPMTNARTVVCLDDLEIYPSATAAALHYDVDKSALIELCLGRRGRKTVGGHRFCYVEDYKPELATIAETV